MMQNMKSGNENVSLVLPTSTRLSGACLTENGIAAVDGYSPYIFLFDGSGCFEAAVPARRAYDSISSNDAEVFVCCGCGCDKNIYFLNDRFEETGVMTPDRSDGKTISASFYTEPPLDNCVAVTFDKSVKLFRRSGEYVSTLKESNTDTYYLCYQSFPGGDCVAYEKDGVSRISVNDDANTKCSVSSEGSCTVPKSFILKPCGDILCVVGCRYLYNYLLPVLTDGTINAKCDF